MTTAIFDLEGHMRFRLVQALETEMLPWPCTEAALRSVLGVRDGVEPLIAALAELKAMGISGPGAGAWIESVDKAAARTPRPDLVWSGPPVPGVHARETRDVYEELFGMAERSLWVSTYVYHGKSGAFDLLAKRMEEVPTLDATVLIHIDRHWQDTTDGDELVRRFAEEFWAEKWVGERKPKVYYDPRAVEAIESAEAWSARGVLHAKATVVDDEVVFVTSANLTGAALDRNVELGLLHRDRALAKAVSSHFRKLIEVGRLVRLPGGR